MEIRDKTIVIIGGSSGIGLAVAKAAAAKGATVRIAGRTREKLQKAVQEIASNTSYQTLDARNEGDVKAFFDRMDVFDHLVSTIHANEPSVLQGLARPVSGIATEAAREWMESKFWGQYFCAKYGSQKLSPSGSITLTGAAATKRWVANHAAISAGNAAIHAFATALAREIGPKRVNVVAPSLTDTPAQRWIPEPQREVLFRNKAETLPVKHVAKPEEIALAYIYLMECDFHTADVLCVDGGHSVTG